MESLSTIEQKKHNACIRELDNFTQNPKFILGKNNPATNISNVHLGKCFHIESSCVGKFFMLLEQCRKRKLYIHYNERQVNSNTNHSGIMIDLDIYQRTDEKIIQNKHINKLIRRISKLLYRTLKLTDDDSFNVFVIQKPQIAQDITKNCFKDGFHILIPEIWITRDVKKYIVGEMINKNIMEEVFKDIKDNLIISPNEILDKQCASVPVHFFGCSKVNKVAYLLSYCYKVSYDDGDINIQNFTIDSIYDEPSVDSHLINLSYELSLSFYLEKINIIAKIKQKLPTWLKKRKIECKDELKIIIQEAIKVSKNNNCTAKELEYLSDSISILAVDNAEVEHLDKLLETLDISYARDYDKWFKVLCAIANTNVDYKPLAIKFSMRCKEKWSESEFEKVWNDIVSSRVENPITISSIIHWAKKSNKEKYDKIQKDHCDYILLRSIYETDGDVSHSDVAKLCVKMLGHKFITDGNEEGKKYKWFEFVTPKQKMKRGEVYKWRHEPLPDNLYLFISDQLPKVFNRIINNYLKDKKEKTNDKELIKYWAKVEAKVRKKRIDLGNNSFQRNVIDQCAFRFRCRGFLEELDSYEDIIGVGNGVLKIGEEPKLIQGFHEYRISKFTETNYIPYDVNNPKVKELLSAFRDIFPEKDVFEFMLFHASTGLDAKESACLLLLLVGGGQNGKTFFGKMVHNTLGNQYCANGKSALLTANMERSESANSAQMQMRDKRYFYFDEFNKAEELNSARLKSIVNPGWQSGRDLHQKQANFKNTCNPIAFSNFDFMVETTDHGTWRRIYYYKNKIKFCRNPNPNNKYEKKVKPELITKCTNDPEYKSAMLSILTHYYSRLCKEYNGDIKNIPVPTIKKETEAFRTRQDVLDRYITQMIVKSPNANKIPLPSLASKYRDWYDKNVQANKMSAIEAQSQFENSRIAPYLERQYNGLIYLTHHRVKSHIGDSLQENEEELIHNNCKENEVIEEEEFDDDFNL